MYKYFMLAFLIASTFNVNCAQNTTVNNLSEITFENLIATLAKLPKDHLGGWVLASNNQAVTVEGLMCIMKGAVCEPETSKNGPERWIWCKEVLGEQREEDKILFYGKPGQVGKSTKATGNLPWSGAVMIAAVENARQKRLNEAEQSKQKKQSAGD